MGRTREEICLLKHELSYQCDSLTDEKRVVGVGRGGGGGGVGWGFTTLPSIILSE